jgi:hypothetical protein
MITVTSIKKMLLAGQVGSLTFPSTGHAPCLCAHEVVPTHSSRGTSLRPPHACPHWNLRVYVCVYVCVQALYDGGKAPSR